MKKIRFYGSLGILAALLFASSAIAQETYTKEIIIEKIKALETPLTLSDYTDFEISNQYTDDHNQITHVYLQQQGNGVEIANATFGLHFNNQQEVVYHTNHFHKNLNKVLPRPVVSLSATEAVQATLTLLNIPPEPLEIISTQNNASQGVMFGKGNVSLHDIPAKVMYEKDEKGDFKVVWNVEIYTKDAQHYWVVRLDAQSGDVLYQKDMVLHCQFHTEATHDHSENCSNQYKESVGQSELSSTLTQFQYSLNGLNNYRVYDAPFESPNHGNRTLVYTDGDAIASPYGWLYDGNTHYNITKGNNAFAYFDPGPVGTAPSPGQGGIPAVGIGLPGAGVSFDFPIDLTQDPSTYRDAAITNLFYWNNYMHDVFYHYGFTEAAGNFQSDNLGNGGLGNDYVFAEAQDGSGTNNANMLTLPDGVPPRMQMYLFSASKLEELVHIQNSPNHPTGGITFDAIEAPLGTNNTIDATGIAGELVLIESNSAAAAGGSTNGCGTGAGAPLPPNNNVTGKIVLIDRGDCSFVEKILGAQLGGAIGVIIANNIPGAEPIAMGGDQTGAAIVIPAVMITFEDGVVLKNELATGITTIALRRDVPAPPMKDGDLDNGIIAHEYGHGISSRLTGGPSTGCLGGDEQGGEGWSDFFGLFTTMTPAQVADAGMSGRGIGTYVTAEDVTGIGIRPARYSRDFAVNDYTYARIDTATNLEITIPHGVGFIWATMLHDMTWDFIEAYGYDSDVVNGTGGNNIAMQLVIDGLKLQPCSPTFVEMRDAILAADLINNGGVNQCLIWKAFARRGLGFSAVAGSNLVGDEIEAFDVPADICSPNIHVKMTANNVVTDGQNLTYTYEITNKLGVTLSNVLVANELPNQTSFESASNGGTETGGIVTFPTFNLGPNATVTRTLTVNVNTGSGTDLLFFDDAENGAGQMNALPGLNAWSISNHLPHSGNYTWFAANPDNTSEQILEFSSAIVLPSEATLNFTHRYNTEANFDGGVVELSNDGGLTWYDLGALMTQNGYTDHIPAANNPMINGFAFGGDSKSFHKTIVDLSIFSGQTVNIRFRFSSDFATNVEGWYIDDIYVAENPVTIENTVNITTGGGDFATQTVETVVVAPNSAMAVAGNNTDINQFKELTTSKTQILNEGTVRLYPNPASDYVQLDINDFVGENIQVQLFNAQGQLLEERNNNQAQIRLNVGKYPAGFYLVKVQGDNDSHTTQLILK